MLAIKQRKEKLSISIYSRMNSTRKMKNKYVSPWLDRLCENIFRTDFETTGNVHEGLY